MNFDEIAANQGWDDESVITILKQFINTVDPTGQALPRFAQAIADAENGEGE